MFSNTGPTNFSPPSTTSRSISISPCVAQTTQARSTVGLRSEWTTTPDLVVILIPATSRDRTTVWARGAGPSPPVRSGGGSGTVP